MIQLLSKDLIKQREDLIQTEGALLYQDILGNHYDDWLQNAFARDGLVLVAKHKVVVGTITVLYEKQHQWYQEHKADFSVSGMYVGSKSKGIGGELMQAALAKAREAGKQRAILSVHVSNQRAIDFYVKQGFTAKSCHRYHGQNQWLAMTHDV